MPGKLTAEVLLRAMRQLAREGQICVSSTQLIAATAGSPATVKRLLERLRSEGRVAHTGQARASRYTLIDDIQNVLPQNTQAESSPRWSSASLQLQQRLSTPLASRDPVTYQRDFVDSYRPNGTSLIPTQLAAELAHLGRMQGQQPAGTYARKVLEPLLIDLSWSSSRLEGNRFSLLATEELFKNGVSEGNIEAVMLLNHKSAIEFLVDSVPTQGLTLGLIRNLHAVLMQNLVADTDALGAIRRKVVNISDTTYVPMQAPLVLQEMLENVINKARLINNPIEAAFFLWVNLAYLQPFEDGNKRTSRLAANIPLMLFNCSPLAFLDVQQLDYAQAMLGVYEFCDVAMAVDLFEWTYRRSQKKYVVVLQSMSAPDPMRLRYRDLLNDAIGLIVRARKRVDETLSELGATEEANPGFRALLTDEINKLEVFNCARYRLPMSATEAWIAAGRPY